jgi:hypothetical protein
MVFVVFRVFVRIIWSSNLKNKVTILALILMIGISFNLLAIGEQLPQKNPPQKEIPQRDVPPKPQVQKKQDVFIPPAIKRSSQKKSDEQVQANPLQENKDITLFPDDYSELDDYTNLDTKDNEVILKTLEHARQKYLQAIILVEKNDTATATNYFEKSIEILNRIAVYPGIEKNKSFIDLAQSVISYYERIVKSMTWTMILHFLSLGKSCIPKLIYINRLRCQTLQQLLFLKILLFL